MLQKSALTKPHAKKGRDYITVVADLDNSKVLYLTHGKDSSTIESFKEDFLAHSGDVENISQICCDMSPAFIRGSRENFPEAEVTYDKFHVMKKMNEAVDQVRREEQVNNALLKRTRYIWLKNPQNLTSKQKKSPGNLKDMNLKTVRAYNLKLSLQMFLSIEDLNAAVKYLKKWYFWATHSRLEPIIAAAKSIGLSLRVQYAFLA